MNYADSTMNIADSTLIGNLAVGGAGQTENGGGIENQSATMTLSDSTLIGNQSIGGAGGGRRQLTRRGRRRRHLQRVRRDADRPGQHAHRQPGHRGRRRDSHHRPPAHRRRLGGGIANASGSTLTLIDSTLSGNVAQGGSSTAGIGGSAAGGGIENKQSSTLTVTDSIFAGNQALGGSGGSGFGGGFGGGGGLDDSRNSSRRPSPTRYSAATRPSAATEAPGPTAATAWAAASTSASTPS